MTRSPRHLSLLLLTIPLIQSAVARAENWPAWRGKDINGLCTEKNLAIEWSPTKNIAWKLPLPGPAGSTPVVWNDKIFLSSVDKEGKLLLMCVSTSGQELWSQSIAQGNKDVRGDEGNSASPSPVTDGEHVWIFMANGWLACFDLNGKEVWKFNVEERYGKLVIQFGMTSTPVLDKDVLYLQLIHGEGNPATREACVVALEKKTGKQIWHVKRESDAKAENEHSYASPILYRDDKQEFLLTHGADFIIAHALKDGKELWRCGELNPKAKYDNTLRFVASPVWVNGLIIAPSAKKGPVRAIKPGGSGDITQDTKFAPWTHARTPDVPSPLVHEGLVYLCMENGNLDLLEADTGKLIYSERTHRERHRASPVYADGHVYLTARDGKVSVVKAGREFKIVAENELGENMTASPAISNGVIYLRTFNQLWAVKK